MRSGKSGVMRISPAFSHQLGIWWNLLTSTSSLASVSLGEWSLRSHLWSSSSTLPGSAKIFIRKWDITVMWKDARSTVSLPARTTVRKFHFTSGLAFKMVEGDWFGRERSFVRLKNHEIDEGTERESGDRKIGRLREEECLLLEPYWLILTE